MYALFDLIFGVACAIGSWRSSETDGRSSLSVHRSFERHAATMSFKVSVGFLDFGFSSSLPFVCACVHSLFGSLVLHVWRGDRGSSEDV